MRLQSHRTLLFMELEIATIFIEMYSCTLCGRCDSRQCHYVNVMKTVEVMGAETFSYDLELVFLCVYYCSRL